LLRRRQARPANDGLSRRAARAHRSDLRRCRPERVPHQLLTCSNRATSTGAPIRRWRDMPYAKRSQRSTRRRPSPAGQAPPDQFLRAQLAALVAQIKPRAGWPGRRCGTRSRVILDIYLSENRAWLAEERRSSPPASPLRAALELALRALVID